MVVAKADKGSSSVSDWHDQERHFDGVHIELDELHWEANWIEVPDEIFRLAAFQRQLNDKDLMR